MTQKHPAMINTLLDTDAYKLHMQQAVFHHYPTVPVVAEFRCRDNDLLGIYVDEIKEQLAFMQNLQLGDQEYNYLATLPFFKKDYLDWLKQYRYNADQISIHNNQGQLAIRIEGKWLDVILWEVPLLALISEVVHRHRAPEEGAEQAIEKLQLKLKYFTEMAKGTDLSDFHILEFGTRRRFSHEVQQFVLSYLKEHFPYLSATSNYHFARILNISPAGTQAHEWFQAHQQIAPSLEQSQRMALSVWLQEYPNQLGIALTDCISMDAFLRDFDNSFANRYSGLRHDSGNAIEWGEKAIHHYHMLGIDPLTKTLVFSDSLTFDKALKIYQHFHKRINLSFGIGTYLTCDLPTTKSLNIVLKLIECNGRPVAKLSDSPGKTVTNNMEYIHQLRQAFKLP